MGKLEKMTITPCSVDDSGDIKASGSGIEVMLNPSSFSHNLAISYSKEEAQGANGKDLKFKNIEPDAVSFELVLDGTGVVPGSSQSVKDLVDALKKTTYEYAGKEHQPRPVRLSWGNFLFYCRLKSLDMEYTLFKPSGDPLRAKAKLSLSKYMSKEEQALRKNNSSPDLTHTIEVKAGDTLPLLCNKVYKDPSYYPEIARINGLNSLIGLQPGQRLKFPPLQ
ncbi:MAG: hypothetical protein QTN59_13780 [Candidatus Electrothrix communis]|nr:hypothetical protein [Desulfobulbus sp. US4]WLE95743.1 MAG: hypothetical protein QTN59_13780 [Candidatus Electrothrix communis]